MSVAGVVRTRDIRYDNTILSHQIANADVEYRQKGLVPSFFRPASLLRIGAVALVAAAVLLGSPVML